MKRIFTLIFVVYAGTISAQHLPGSAQPFQFAPLFNPAFTGIENYGDVKLAYRYQWAAFKENAPQFLNVSYAFRIKQPLDLKVNALRTSRSDFTNMVPRFRLNIQGLGINVFSDKYGPINRVGGGLQYAIHVPVSEKVYVSAGAAATLENTRLSGEDLYFGENPDPDPFIDKLKNGSTNHSELWTRVGLLIYGEKFYIGAAYYPYNATVATSDVAFTDPFYKGNLQAGVSLRLNEDIEVKPSVFALWQNAGDIMLDYSAKFYLQERAWFGLTYRDIKSGIASAGFHINEKFSVAYSFEFSLGELRTFTGSSHDVVISWRVKNLKRANQYTW